MDLGCGAMDLERFLPDDCEYWPVDLYSRDERTRVCDLNAGEFPDLRPDVVTMLGVLEYLQDPIRVLRCIRALNVPLVCSYSITDRTPLLDRRTQGWINDLSFHALHDLMQEVGFFLRHRELVDNCQDLFEWVPDAPKLLTSTTRQVLVLSYLNDANFGDRLGYHIINELLPPNALVTHATVLPWTVPDRQFDMLILGIGNSLNAATVRRPELHALMERTPINVGIFGTQYRSQYTKLIKPELLPALLDKLTIWYARYEDDIHAFARGRDHVAHLGDWLISSFPNTLPTLDETLMISSDIKNKDLPLDRVIQQIQAYKRVSSARIHPLLCALTSAEQVKYQEQYEYGDNLGSGKFRSQLMDIFGRTYRENVFFDVDKDAVMAYRAQVVHNMAQMRQQLAEWLK